MSPRNDDTVDRRDGAVERPHSEFGLFGGQRAAPLAVHAHHLLVAGDDAGFQRGGDRCILLDRSRIDADSRRRQRSCWPLAAPGEIYAIYLPHGGRVTVQLQPARYAATWWNAATGGRMPFPLLVTAPSWTSPAAPGSGDWALLLQRK